MPKLRTQAWPEILSPVENCRIPQPHTADSDALWLFIFERGSTQLSQVVRWCPGDPPLAAPDGCSYVVLNRFWGNEPSAAAGSARHARQLADPRRWYIADPVVGAYFAGIQACAQALGLRSASTLRANANGFE